MSRSSLASNEPAYFRDYGPPLRDGGYHPIPTVPCSKAINLRGWSRWCRILPPVALVQYWSDKRSHHGVGFGCGTSTTAIDIDETDPEKADETEAFVTDILGRAPVVRIGS